MKGYLDDEEKIKQLKRLVDQACEKIKDGKLTLGEAKKEAALARLKAKSLIPEDMEKFDLIYGSRLKRMIQQFVEKMLDDERKSR